MTGRDSLPARAPADGRSRWHRRVSLLIVVIMLGAVVAVSRAAPDGIALNPGGGEGDNARAEATQGAPVATFPAAANLDPGSLPRTTPGAGTASASNASARPGSDPDDGETGATGTPAATDLLADLSDAERALLAHIPDEMRPGCLPAEEDEAMPEAVATLACETYGAADTVRYALYDDLDQLHEAFFSVVPEELTPEELESGSCADEPPAASSYTNADGDQAGYILCFPAGEDYAEFGSLAWTDDSLLIATESRRADGDVGALYRWWATGAPGPEPVESGPPGEPLE